jgi:hypothetical protein
MAVWTFKAYGHGHARGWLGSLGILADNAGLSLAQLCGTLSISDIYPQRNSTVKLLY